MTQIEMDALHAIVRDLPRIANSLDRIADVLEKGQVAIVEAK